MCSVSALAAEFFGFVLIWFLRNLRPRVTRNLALTCRKLPSSIDIWFFCRLYTTMGFLILYFISQNFQVLIISWYQSSHIFARHLNFLSKFLKLHNIESQFCELLRPQAPPVLTKKLMKPFKPIHF